MFSARIREDRRTMVAWEAGLGTLVAWPSASALVGLSSLIVLASPMALASSVALAPSVCLSVSPLHPLVSQKMSYWIGVDLHAVLDDEEDSIGELDFAPEDIGLLEEQAAVLGGVEDGADWLLALEDEAEILGHDFAVFVADEEGMWRELLFEPVGGGRDRRHGGSR